MPARIVTSTYRYKRPPRKRKAVPFRSASMNDMPPSPSPRHDQQESAMPSRIVTWTYREAPRLAA
jgi:hypothetical protein